MSVFDRHLPSDQSMAECLKRMQEIAQLERQMQIRHFDATFLKALRIVRD